ncbi:MAG: peptidoglycan-associated lipoprotein Pal [Caldimicrobium sp.]|jgi:peptidoglycan-associated lipoprotein
MRKIVLFFLILFISACAKKEVPPVVEVPKAPPPSEEKREVKPEKGKEEQEIAQILGEEKKIKGVEEGKVDREHWKLYGRSTPPLLAIFFDFDDFSIRDDMWDRIKANAKYLLENPKVKVELQGNCDERGTNEYNMALGMKRALEVKKALIKLGIDEKRINVVSFGEEKPLCLESDESCWAINRRVDFVIKNF